MSAIDHSLQTEFRQQLLSEVRGFLPTFLSGKTSVRESPVIAAAELLDLSTVSLRRILAAHALMSAPITGFISAVPNGTRRPLMASNRERVAQRAVTSGIDWASTIRHRATSSPTEPEWVTRPALRTFDLPENRALAWLLQEIRHRSETMRFADEAKAGWQKDIVHRGEIAAKAQSLGWLRTIPPDWPGDQVYKRLLSDRSGFYKLRVAPAAKYLRKFLHLPTVNDLVEAICERYFEPSQDWKLYEIAVLFRIIRELAANGDRVGNFHTLDSTRQPIVCYRMNDKRIVNIWYQRWPKSSGPSELLDAIYYYGTGHGGNRPDIVVEILNNNTPERLIILELKASYSSSYLSSGFSQLLSYLRDRPELTTPNPAGWLVAPSEHGAALDPEGRALWLVSADDVAAAVLDVVR